MLTKKEEAYIKSVEDHCEEIGVETVARKIATGELELNSDNYIKFNLPDTEAKFKEGNGEGVWGIPLTEEGQALYDLDIVGEFKVIILNDAVYYPFPYGTVLNVEQRGGETRPVLSEEYKGLLDER